MKKIRIVCENPACPDNGKEFNAVLMGTATEADIGVWLEAYGHGIEDPEDFCPKCGRLGVAQEPEETPG